MNRERFVLLFSLLLLFVVMTGALVWSHVFNAKEVFMAGTRPSF